MNDTLSQILIYLPFGLVLLVVFICLCRLYLDRKSDAELEAESENLERIDQRAGKEARDCSERIREIKDGTRELFEATDIAREQIKSASDEISRAREDNRTAKEAISEIEKILDQAKEI